MTKGKVIKIAVDAMGGDYAPSETVEGAVDAAKSGDVEIGLVGDLDAVNAEMAKHDTEGLPITIIPSEGVVLEGESPALALRRKPRSSILVSTGLVKQGQADAAVTMGSTGAAMAAAAVILGVIEGVERPALGGPIVGLAPRTVVLDLGSNVDCRPTQMLSFAVIGHVLARSLWGIESPRIALLSVGGESGKGNKIVQETTPLLLKSGLNFVGNVEANDLPQGVVEVAVCDGFVGNVVMKLTEGFGSAMVDHLRKNLGDKLSEDDMEALTTDVYEVNNVSETWGGGPLLGVNGVSVVGHGRAKAGSVCRAIETAKRFVQAGFVEGLNKELVQVRHRVGG